MATNPTRAPRAVRTPGAAPAAQPAAEGEAAPSAAAERPLPSTPVAQPSSDLPNAIDIDARAIRGPVLTKQGWVCPDETGVKPADALKP